MLCGFSAGSPSSLGRHHVPLMKVTVPWPGRADSATEGAKSNGSRVTTYQTEADAPERSYDEAVGWALQYGILVYRPGTGGRMKALGMLRNEIKAYEIEHGLVT